MKKLDHVINDSMNLFGIWLYNTETFLMLPIEPESKWKSSEDYVFDRS